MIISLSVIICMLLFTSMVSIVYFNKKRIQTFENRIYKMLLLGSLFGLIIEISCFASIYFIDLSSIGKSIAVIINKLFIIYLLFWEILFTEYISYISFEKNEKIAKINDRIFKRNYLIIGIFVLMIIFLPIDFYHDNEYIYSYGLSTDLVMFIGLICIIIDIICFAKNTKKINKRKLIPMLILIVFMIFAAVIRSTYPGITLVNSAFAFVTILMYFTIENPDVNMLNEMSKNKELMEQGYEDKYNFLFEMTQEARGPLVNINNLTNALRLEDDPKKVKDGLLVLNNLVRQLDFSINDILNISSLDAQKIKVVNNRYQLDKLCNELDVRIKSELKDGVKFEISLPKQLPELYGDYMKIRQILYSLLLNSCQNTESGNINMRVNVIERYDVCRVVFNISDTGCGMSIEKINEILSATGSLDKNEIDNLEKKEFNVKLCQKVVKIMGGNLMIKSNVGEGTDVILTIDQRVYHKEDNSILNQYENAIINYRKVLLVSQNKNILSVIKKKLVDNHITYTSLYSGNDAIDRIKAGKKFDFVIVDDEMAELSGFMTLEGMKKIKGFNIPVIIMLKEDKEHIKEHYLEDGFTDYILLNNLENELDRVIEKY